MFEMSIFMPIIAVALDEIARWLSSMHLDFILLHIALERFIGLIERVCKRFQCNASPVPDFKSIQYLYKGYTYI